MPKFFLQNYCPVCQLDYFQTNLDNTISKQLPTGENAIRYKMTTSLLIRTFRQLSPKDLRAMRQWARCGVFNRREDVALLCEYLVDNINKTSAKGFSAEALWAAMFPDKPLDNKQLRHIMSFLLTAIRQYIAWSEWQTDEADMQRYLLKGLRQRGLDQMFEKAWENGTEQVNEQPIRDAQYHFSKYLLHQEHIEHTSRRERSAKLNLQPLPDELTTFYLSEMLRYACLAHIHQAVAGQVYRLDLLQIILKTAGRQEMLQMPAVALYYHAYRMLESPAEDEPFERLKLALKDHEHRFSQEEMRGLYLMAINGCIRRLNAGRKAYVREAFDLYAVALERGFLMENGVLSGFTYKNILRVAVGLGEHDWAEQFLEKQRNNLHPKERDNLYRYNLAYLRFRQRDFTRALPLLQQVDLEDVLNNLDARRMLLQTYFELQEWDALESLLLSFSAFLRRQKNLGYHRTTNENLIAYTKKIMETDRKDRTALKSLYQEIEPRDDVAEKAWLLERCS